MTDRPLRILILEDNEVVIAALKSAIGQHFAGAQLRIERQTDKLTELTPDKAGQFDAILLDYVCLTGGNFHQAPLEAMGIERVISMSSTDNFNNRAIARGASVAIKKPLRAAELAEFVKEMVATINRILPKSLPRRTDGLSNYSDKQKKERERELIEEFLSRCVDFTDYQFQAYDENPDLVYRSQKNHTQLGFESVIVTTRPTMIE